VTSTDPFAGIPNADDSERRQFDAPAKPRTQAGYDRAAARYNVITENMPKISRRLTELREELDREWREASAELSRYERAEGLELPGLSATGASLEGMEAIETAALGRLVEMFPWARLA